MSVNEGNRREGKLKTLNKCRELALYTLTITKNDKTFSLYEVFRGEDGEILRTPSEVRLDLLHSIVRHATNVYQYAWLGNSIRVGNGLDWARRDNYQNAAIDSCNMLLVKIGLAKTVFHLKSKRVKHWGEQTLETRKMLRAWHDADTARYGEKLKEVPNVPIFTLAVDDGNGKEQMPML